VSEGQVAGAAATARAPSAGGARIALLEPLVADQIAAGEVIERPASVVKELVENALDAGAREIEVELRDGGRELVCVRDDGAGIHPDDVPRACLRHATSKLRTLDDLSRIGTHGFRGEALASIAAVAEVTITTRARGADAGVRAVIADGAVRDLAPAGAPPGTTVEVRGLFASLPARRKFLRSAATETSHIAELLQRLALARPEIGIACRQGGRDLLRYPAVGRADERLRQVLGAPRARAMLRLAPDGGPVGVSGFVSRAGESLPQARSVLTYVNGRLVRDRLLLRAILDAYRALLPQGRYPLAVVRVDVPPEAVDVNVHPTKSEVRFGHGDAVYAAVLRAVRSALAAGVAAPASAAGESAIVPDPARAASTEPGGTRVVVAPVAGARVAEALGRYASRSETAAARAGVPSTDGAAIAPSQRATREAGRIRPDDRSGLPFRDGAHDDAAGRTDAVPRFASLRVIGQAFGGYIVCEGRDALVLVDQHAAHERVRFERLRQSLAFDPASRPPSQKLLVPRAVELDEASCARLVAAASDLVAAGFEVEPFGERAILVRALPAALDVTTDPEVLLAEIARDLADVGPGERLQAARDALLARIACHGAVRAGESLTRAEMAQILADLDTIPFAATCPHGRPLLAEVPRAEIARRVRRT